jgi:class 3 adenylate cyclase
MRRVPDFGVLPPTRYTKVGGSSIAYQVIGDGPIDVIWVTSWFSHIDGRWQEPRWHRFWTQMSSWCRLIMYDRRGSGASDSFPDGTHPTWEEWVEDIAAVMDAAGSERAAVVASSDAGPSGALFAAMFPARVSALVLVNSSARFLRAPDYPFGVTQEEAESVIVAAERTWGNEALVEMVVPSMAHDRAYLEFWARYQRMVASPMTAGRQMRLQILTADIREILPSIKVPTLVLHRKGVTMPIHTIEHGRYLAEHIPAARLVELEGDDVVLPLGDQDGVVAEIQEFVTGVRPVPDPDRILATVMFTDIVESTRRLSEVGDSGWRRLLDEHEALVRQQIESFGGRMIRTTGDGVLATFNGPARAIRCAGSIRRALEGLGLTIRVGVHTGEIEVLLDDVAGIAVHTAARITSEAAPDEILVSSLVRDLAAGSGIDFADRGVRSLRGVKGDWQLLAASA